MTQLEEFWANSNDISRWQEVSSIQRHLGVNITISAQVDKLSACPSLATVYLEYNPVAKDPQYRRKLKLACPTLTQIDATLCK